ncbi:hypothetical protein K503DRAFT_799696 [Rhizopogon vinicolor AM-OR11-026]|uniref:Uncharacterized protein n=1 Tax=Rhizopogon vinicolor AM-OR11-026 TaxID=1314800 RepID=A0A1B7N3H3_9AGAM|nr:hypothetical protein K503DRAFT_799696 [Rhizopogon vinicolor AM-OR11-026]
MFSKVAPVSNLGNVAALGPLSVIAIMYMVIGFALTLTIKQFFWVPHRFRYGIFVAGGWASIDLSNSVILDITVSFHFEGDDDQTAAIAYSDALSLIFYVTFFTFGRKLVAMDFVGPDQ